MVRSIGLTLSATEPVVITIGIWMVTNSDRRYFDATLGFPGEGPDKWSNKHDNLSMATWNTRSLSFERFNYCQGLGFDVLAITEL